MTFSTVLVGCSALAILGACGGDRTTVNSPAVLDASANRAGYETAGSHRQYGAPVTPGGGNVRPYVVLDAKNGQTPLEVGVAIDERVLGTLPANMRMLHLPLPARGPAPYNFVMCDWNPNGHEPKEFTTTFIYGSWTGKFTFLEPMVTATNLRSRPDTRSSIATPTNAASIAAFNEAGRYPSAYRVVYDAQAKEYRVGLASLAWRQ